MNSIDESTIPDFREKCRAILIINFYKSWLAVWDEGIYFDNEVQPLEDRFLHPDREAIAEIAGYDFFTLFEASILIDERTDSSFIGNQVEIYVDAIMNGQLMPRDPSMYLKWIDIPSRKLEGVPDLNWVISRQELYEFASTRWPPYLFADLRDDESETTQGEKINSIRNSTITIKNAYVYLLHRYNHEPRNEEVWQYLKSQAGMPNSGVAEFLEDAETEDCNGKLSFINADGSLIDIGYKALKNNLAKIRASYK